jgi:hypothetical protein
VSTSKVLYEHVTSNRNSRAMIGLSPRICRERAFNLPMVTFNTVVPVLLRVVEHVRQLRSTEDDIGLTTELAAVLHRTNLDETE